MEYITKWKYESYKNEYKNRDNEVNNTEVQVIKKGKRDNKKEHNKTKKAWANHNNIQRESIIPIQTNMLKRVNTESLRQEVVN